MTRVRPREEVFVDTSGFKALVDPEDEFHARAVKMWSNLAKTGVTLVTSNYILDECYTLIRVRCGINVAAEFRELLATSGKEIRVMRVTLIDEFSAWDWFENDWSKLSFTDCISFAMMKRFGLTKFFGFDAHFERAGFNPIVPLQGLSS